MTHSLFVIFDAPNAIASDADLDRVAAIVRKAPGFERATLLTPVEAGADQPFAADGRGPALALQIDVATERDLQTLMRADGPLAALAAPDALPSLAGAGVSHQPMRGRDFATPDPQFRLPPGGLPCTFFVQYPGTTADLPAWLDHYDANHPPIMVRFPAIREVMTFRPLDNWNSSLPWARGTAMQRNKVVFDSTDALVAALTSPVMDEMRADGATFPPYSPRATHHPMNTRVVRAS